MAVVAALGLGGCVVNPVPTPEKTSENQAGGGTGFGQDTLGSLDSGASLDSGGFDKTDVSMLDSSTADASSADSATGADVTSDSGGDTTLPGWICDLPGEPGCPCQQDNTCASGHCIATPNQGMICTAECKAGCPSGYGCIAQGSTDLIYLCMPKWPVLCNPCDADVDCAAVGSQKALCVDRGALGRFCGAGCLSDADCPAGNTCQQATSISGKTAQQCLPAPGVDGPTDCSCSAAAVTAELGTTCIAQAKDSSGIALGQCSGVRQCGKDGLTKCTAVIGLELCNGKDDDCDGQTDEAACDDGNPCTTDGCDAAALACGHTATTGSCDADGNACTVGDECQDGKCAAGPVKKCDDGNPCTLDSCAMASGCTAVDDNGVGCDDGDGCSVGDTCKAGQCVPGKPKLCPTGKLCQVVQCDSGSGQCKSTAQPDGASCDDGTACTQADTCATGACSAKALDCNDNNVCTQDTCDPVTGCAHTAAKAPCNDGNACSGPDVCSGGQCTGLPLSATACDDNNPCTNDLCDPKSGCVAAANQAACQDGNPCTQGDTCKDKQCVAGTSTCQCQKDSDCAEDGNLCNGVPFCDKSTANFACKTNPATVVKCDTTADSLCAVNSCAPLTGKCAPVAAIDGKPCDADGSLCTDKDSCSGGKCLPGAILGCDDGNPCTADACDPKAGCTHTNTSAACDADGSQCTDKDSCSGGKCLAGALLNCDDANPCTIDSCAPAKGCQHNPETDGTECGTYKGCKAGVCEQLPYCGDKVVNGIEQCDDGNQVSGDGCSATCNFDKIGPPKQGDIVISEVMVAPSIQTDEWVEVLNISDHAVDLNGLYFGDLQFYIVLTKSGGFIVQPGQYVVISAMAKPAGVSTFVPDYVYGYSSGSIAFANDSDEACISFDKDCKTGIVARVPFAQQSGGASYQLSADKLTYAAMKLGTSWCKGSVPFGTKGDLATPGKLNSLCK